MARDRVFSIPDTHSSGEGAQEEGTTARIQVGMQLLLHNILGREDARAGEARLTRGWQESTCREPCTVPHTFPTHLSCQVQKHAQLTLEQNGFSGTGPSTRDFFSTVNTYRSTPSERQLVESTVQNLRYLDQPVTISYTHCLTGQRISTPTPHCSKGSCICWCAFPPTEKLVFKDKNAFFFWIFEFYFIYFLYSRFLLVIHFIHISVYMSIPISQFIPPPPPCHFPPLASIHLFSTSVSLFLPCKLVHLYHFSRFHIYVLIYDHCFSLSDLLHSVWQSKTLSDSGLIPPNLPHAWHLVAFIECSHVNE